MRARAGAWLACAAALLAVGPARAHVLFERPTLRQWLAGSDLALIVEIEGDTRMWRAADGSDRQEWLRARVVDTLRGEAPGHTLDFFPRAEGFPRFRDGARALLFLERTAERPEFASLAKRFPWFSAQGAGQEWLLEGADGEAIVEIARRWSALARIGGNPRRAVRELLLAELGSGVARLRTDAIDELVLARVLPGFLDAATTRAFAAWADAPALPATQRLAVARLLEGAPGFEVGPRLRALAHEPLSGPALAQLLRVAAATPDPELRTWLHALARDDARPEVRRQAAAVLARAPALP